MAEYVFDYDGWDDAMSSEVGPAWSFGIHKAMSKVMHERKHERIVRCRDCKHCREHDMRAYGGDRDQLLCHHFSMDSGAGWPVKPDGFCAWGERRDANDGE